ncbi:hypothetical protein NDU88_001185 [Pleurodeles waltl]|uniref:Metalloendopeptidase n=1 Tax=Pleurodeles waltl TaxID=8319 RepID=A0AAV7LWW0_PLEWA|nr:hypothetical protein NDU88_001185 [Pleurodeles waltl]
MRSRRRDVTGCASLGGESLKSTFDIIAEANENVVQQPGKYFVIDLDTVRSTKRIAGMCSSGTCTWRKNPDGNVYIPYTQAKDYSHEYEFEMDDTNNIKYTPYDYGSILHYGKKAYSKDGVSQTLIPVPDSSVNIGQTFAMSDVDIQKINLLYHCGKFGQVWRSFSFFYKRI